MNANLTNVFNKFLENKPIFTNRNALTISFTPDQIPHREGQVSELGRIVAPVLKGAKPSNVFLYGRTGTGKTCVSRLVGQQLEETAKKAGINAKVIYVNCKMKKIADTEYRLIAYLIKEFGKEVPFTGLPTDRVYQIFYDVLDSQKQHVILIIDEIDTLVKKTGDEILYNITRINQDLKNSRLSIIGITNDLGFIDNLDPRVKSSLSEEEMIFPPYNALQLQDILRERSKMAFVEGVLEPGVIEKCAALAAQEHGDARRALDLLRVAGELAEREAQDKVSIKHVDIAEDKIDVDRTSETIKSQPRQSKAVLWAVMKLAEKTKEINTGDVIDLYNKICDEHSIKKLTQRRISDLISELELFGVIATKVISKGRYGRTRVITIQLSDQTINKVRAIVEENFK